MFQDDALYNDGMNWKMDQLSDAIARARSWVSEDAYSCSSMFTAVQVWSGMPMSAQIHIKVEVNCIRPHNIASRFNDTYVYFPSKVMTLGKRAEVFPRQHMDRDGSSYGESTDQLLR